MHKSNHGIRLSTSLFLHITTLSFVFTCFTLVSSLQSIDLENPVITIKPQQLQTILSRASKDALSCERIHVVALSRYKLESYGSSIHLTVAPSVVIPEKLHNRIHICLHRNASTGMCQCEKDEWRFVQKGLWGSMTSPYVDKYIDVKFVGDISGPVTVSIEEEFHNWRFICLALGVILLLAAPIVSRWVPFYYSSSMAIGVILVILVLLFQGMKLLPTSRKNFLYLTIYGSLLGTGSFVVHQFSLIVKSILVNFGLSDEMHSPVSIFLVIGIVLGGAALGFWIVRRYVILDDGSVDVGVAQFVKWAMRIIASAFILQGTSDTIFAWVTLALCWVICSVITRRRKRSGFSTPTRWHSPVKGSTTSKKDHYSTFHRMPRRKMSKKEWENSTRESTRQAMEELVSTPEFADWMIEHADLVQFRSDDSSDESVISGTDSTDESPVVQNRYGLRLFNW